MRKFIAYFDYLGFKDFIENNDADFQHRIMHNNFRDIEIALADGKTKSATRGVISDMDSSVVNCMNFSDTIVFWTKDDSDESLQEILRVAYRFNWHSNGYTFPVKGTIVHGEIFHADFRQENKGGGLYNVNSLYGKGLVEAYLKTENQHWAGAVIDQSVINVIGDRGQDATAVLEPFAVEYMVPYKKQSEGQQKEFALQLVKGKLTVEAFANVSKNIERNFGEYNKRTDHPKVQEKLQNTIAFLKTFLG